MRALTLRGSAPTSMPLIVARPLSGVRIPSRISTVVVLPAPLGPNIPKTSPCWTKKDIPSTAWSGP